MAKINSTNSVLNGKIRFANAPISWGINEFGIENKVIQPDAMLDQLKSAGYGGCELGDYGFFPKDNTALNKQFQEKGVEMIAAFCAYALWDPKEHAKGREYARKIGSQLASFQGKQSHSPHIVLADNVIDKNRIKKTGKITQKDSLSPEKWKILTTEVKTLKKLMKEEFGVEVYFHPHCGSFVETPWEIEALSKCYPFRFRF